MAPKDFDALKTIFMAPVVNRLKTTKPTCDIHWVYPNEPEENDRFPLPWAEADSYLSVMIDQGFLAAVRFTTQQNSTHLQIFLWEDWDGEFEMVLWPASNGQITLETVWSGISV